MEIPSIVMDWFLEGNDLSACCRPLTVLLDSDQAGAEAIRVHKTVQNSLSLQYGEGSFLNSCLLREALPAPLRIDQFCLFAQTPRGLNPRILPLVD